MAVQTGTIDVPALIDREKVGGSQLLVAALCAGVVFLDGFGLGHLLHYGRELNGMDQVIGIMLASVALGLLVDRALFSSWERFLHRRWGTGLKRA